MKEKSKQKGITLIALVITIIILLILTGITISQLTGSGIFEKAKEARDNWQNAQNDEEMQIARYSNEIDSIANSSRTISQADINKKIEESCLGFPDYANRTALISGTEYTADENMYIILDTTGLGNKLSVGLELTINGQLYTFYSEYGGVDYRHHSQSIIPIKKGDVFTINFECVNAYKVNMRY